MELAKHKWTSQQRHPFHALIWSMLFNCRLSFEICSAVSYKVHGKWISVFLPPNEARFKSRKIIDALVLESPKFTYELTSISSSNMLKMTPFCKRCQFELDTISRLDCAKITKFGKDDHLYHVCINTGNDVLATSGHQYARHFYFLSLHHFSCKPLDRISPTLMRMTNCTLWHQSTLINCLRLIAVVI